MKKYRLPLEKLKKISRTHLLIICLAGILLLIVALPEGKPSGGEGASDGGGASDAGGIFDGGTASDGGGTSAGGAASDPLAPSGLTVPSAEGAQQADGAYQERMERQLAEVLAEMDGVGKASVMITWKDGGEAQVEKDLTRTEDRSAEGDGQGDSRKADGVSLQEATVYGRSEAASQMPFVKKITCPQVEGVLVVAEGAGSAAVAKNISEAILALFPVEAHKIKVVKMN